MENIIQIKENNFQEIAEIVGEDAIMILKKANNKDVLKFVKVKTFFSNCVFLSKIKQLESLFFESDKIK
jgi:hypothetical protein